MTSIFVVAGAVALVAGVALPLTAFRHDVNRHRIAREVPQAAPKRVAPEVHAVAAIISATGACVLWGIWPAAIA